MAAKDSFIRNQDTCYKRLHFACLHSFALIIEISLHNPLTGPAVLKRNVIGKDRSMLKYSFYDIFRFLCEEH